MSSEETSDHENHEQNLFDSEGDWLLGLINNFCNQIGLEVGVTISVSGVIYTGTIIGANKYFENIMKGIEKNTDTNEIGDLISEHLEGNISLLKENTYPDKQELNSSERASNFVHLKNLKQYHVNNMSNDEIGFWRFRVNSIDGFMLGNISKV